MVGNHQTSIYKWLFGVPGRDLQLTIPGDYFFNGRLDFQLNDNALPKNQVRVVRCYFLAEWWDFKHLNQLFLVKFHRDLTRPVSPKWWFRKGNPRKFQGNPGR